MEAKDLMIGDWVRITLRNKIGKVYRIDEANGKGNGWAAVIDGDYHETHLEPISLTSEILEKNGWVYNSEEEKFFPQTWVGGGLMLQGADDCGYRVVVTSDYDDEDTNNTPFVILYVHELQHALRLRRIKKEIVL